MIHTEITIQKDNENSHRNLPDYAPNESNEMRQAVDRGCAGCAENGLQSLSGHDEKRDIVFVGGRRSGKRRILKQILESLLERP